MTDKPPFICVAIITYNHANYIGQCIQSLLDQTVRPDRIALFDDGSNDGSQDIIREFSDAHPGLFELHLQPKNLGIAQHSLYIDEHVQKFGNIDLLAFLEGDDYWDIKKIEYERDALAQYPEAHFAYSNVAQIFEDETPSSTFHTTDGPPLPQGDLFVKVATRSIFNATRNCFRNYFIKYPSFLKHWEYDTTIPSMTDYQMHLKLSAGGPAAAAATCAPLVYYRRHDSGISNDTSAVALSQMMIYEKFGYLIDARSRLEQLICRSFQENHLSGMAGFFPQEKQGYYHPIAVYQRTQQLLSQLSSAEQLSFRKEYAGTMRSILYFTLIALINSNESNQALKIRLEYHKNDPSPIDTFLLTPSEIHHQLHQAMKDTFGLQGIKA